MTRRIVATLCFLSVLISGLFLTQSLQTRSSSTGRSPDSGRFQPNSQATVGEQTVSEPVIPVSTGAVRDLPDGQLSEDTLLEREVNPRINWGFNPFQRYKSGPDPLLDVQASARAAVDASFLSTILNSNGQGYSFVNPPDPSGDVGPNHFIQMINASSGSSVTIYDKSLNLIKGPFMLDALGTGNCASGLGDPIVLYDRLADRWLLSEFSNGGNKLCLYVSQTPDPTGAYHNYEFAGANGFPDYPKYGVWPDAYYAGTNESVPTVYAFDRVNMLAGNPATYQSFNMPGLSGFGFQMLTPSDLDGATPPPANSPNYLMRHRDTEPHGAGSCANSASSDCLEIFEFKVDWNTPANSTVSASPHTVSITEFDSDLCGLSSYSCIPQSGSSVRLDPLREVVMQRLQYRNFGSHESLVGNLSTDVVGSTTGNDRAGIRWFELRKVGGGNWTLYQEGTYSPDAHSRWMGSTALDQDGNMAVAYNVSSSSMFPGLRYAGRLANDPLGTLLQGEGLIIEGSGANGSNRYGDYSQLNVDPADDCTFWFTGQYNPSSQWGTRIATFKFDSCGLSTPNFTIVPTPSSVDTCHGSAAQYTLNLSANGGFNSPVTLSTSGLGGSSNFSINPISSFPGSSQLNVNSPAIGTHTFDVIATGGALSKSTSLQLNVLDDKITIPQSSILPAVGSILQSENIVLSWSLSTSSIANLTVEVATDTAFTNIIASASNLTTNQYQLSGLQAFTNYYWRVTGDNACGNITSPTYGFMTATIDDSCNTSTLAIPDNAPTGIVSSQTISQSGLLSDLNVSVELTHTYVGDLVITLEHADSGKTVTIIDKPTSNGVSNCGGNNISATFDDAATNIAETTCNTTDPALSGLLKPNGALSSFNGDDFAGTWNLKVSDLASADTGSITQWCLIPDGAFMDFNADLSDLASSYGIAAHKGDGVLSIGTNWTSDTIANQGQDNIDDDGLFIPNLTAGQTDNVVVAISGTPSGANAWLQAWFDWNHNGIFDSGELVFNSAVSVGSNSLSITPPSGFDETHGTNYRFRLFDSATQPAGAPNPQGVVDHGEVTDGDTPFAYISYLPIMLRD